MAMLMLCPCAGAILVNLAPLAEKPPPVTRYESFDDDEPLPVEDSGARAGGDGGRGGGRRN
eukprot:2351822-Pleurochrysis_carterae.AAC.1